MKEEKQKTVNMTDEEFELTEQDIEHLLKSEEDIRLGRVYTMEEFTKRFEKRHNL